MDRFRLLCNFLRDDTGNLVKLDSTSHVGGEMAFELHVNTSLVKAWSKTSGGEVKEHSFQVTLPAGPLRCY